jgi:hypothetical protein
LVKSKQSQIPFPLFNPNESYIVDPNIDFNDEYRGEMFDSGLKLISEGKVGMVINFAGFKKELGLPKNKALYVPSWPYNISILEFYLYRIKSLGQFAVKKYGKNFSKKREPILVFLQTNEESIDVVDKFLLSNDYFGYQGIICFATVRGKLTFLRNKCRIWI